MEARLTIIIPVFNEAQNLDRLYEALIKFLSMSLLPSKVLFVDDGSTDSSLKLIESKCESDDRFEYLSFSKNYGLSAALTAGFDHCTTEWVGYIDADLQTNPEDFNTLIPHLEDHVMVTGIRINRQDGFVKRLSSKFANKIRNLFTKDGIEDTGCPLKIIRTNYAQRIPRFKGMHRFLPAFIMLLNGNVKSVPVTHYPRLAGASKFGLINRSIKPLADCFVYLWMKRNHIDYKISKKS